MCKREDLGALLGKGGELVDKLLVGLLVIRRGRRSGMVWFGAHVVSFRVVLNDGMFGYIMRGAMEGEGVGSRESGVSGRGQRIISEGRGIGRWSWIDKLTESEREHSSRVLAVV